MRRCVPWQRRKCACPAGIKPQGGMCAQPLNVWSFFFQTGSLEERLVIASRLLWRETKQVIVWHQVDSWTVSLATCNCHANVLLLQDGCSVIWVQHTSLERQARLVCQQCPSISRCVERNVLTFKQAKPNTCFLRGTIRCRQVDYC